MNIKIKKGFTLIELLVVVAIIAILMVVVVITLNPGQLLAQSRDSTRLSDMSTLKTAINLYLVSVATTTNLGTKTVCYSYLVSSSCAVWFPSYTPGNNTVALDAVAGRAVDGTGWVPVNLNAISSGAPFAMLPVDPAPSAGTSLFYSYTASGTQLFKFAAKMESIKFGMGGSSDVVSTDGGVDSSTYEVGSGITTL